MKKVQRSAPIFFIPKRENVDSENGIIKDVVILQSGKDKYYENWDRKACEQLVALGNEQGQGVKSRFGHPNMCDTTLGSFIGRYKNFSVGTTTRTDEGVSREVPCVIADLHLDPVSRSTPKGNLYDYVVSMSQKNPDMFGNSIVFIPDESEKVKEKDDKGEEYEVEYMRVKSFLASDLVDSPAATDSLFKDSEDFAAVATQFLEENPGVYEIICKNEGVLKEFLSKYESYKKQKSEMETKKQEKSFLEKVTSAVREAINGKPEKKKESYTTDDGKTINIEGEVAVGSSVSDDQGQPTPNATYKLADGRTIVTDADSKISEVIPAEEAESSTDEKEIVRLKEENKNLKAKVDQIEADRKAEQDGVMKEIEKMNAEIVKLKSQIQSNHKPKPGINTSLHEDRAAGAEKPERNLAEESAKREAERKAKENKK